MDFKIYFRRLDSSAKKLLADSCCVSVGYLKLLAYGHRTASADVAINVERYSNGLVTCESMRPETDWGYIRGTAKEEKSILAINNP